MTLLGSSSNFTLVSAPVEEALRQSEERLTSVELEEGIHPGNSEIVYSTAVGNSVVYILRAAQRLYVQVYPDSPGLAPSWQITGFDSGFNRVVVGEWCVDAEYTRGSVQLFFEARLSFGRVLSKFVRTEPRFALHADVRQNHSVKTLVVQHSGLARPVCISL